MKKKGFTLIELLAVIIILAVIALIATPIVLDVVESAKKSSFESTAYGMIDAMKLKSMEDRLEGISTVRDYTFPSNELDVQGEQLTGAGKVDKEGRIEIALNNGVLCAIKGFYDSTITVKDYVEEECILPGNGDLIYEDETEANEPDLLDNMIPVVYENDSWVYADVYDEWYNYEEQKWANAVVLNSDAADYTVGDPIDMNDIALMYVWIPRYKYTIFNGNNEGVEEQVIDIKFESGTASTGTVSCVDVDFTQNPTSEVSEVCTDTTNGSIVNGVSTYTHPAFTFGDDELTGIWVGKFEIGVPSTSTSTSISTSVSTSAEGNSLVIKPNAYSAGGTVSTLFTAIQNMSTTYSLNVDSHMMKNMEWGAVAYLKQSVYGLGTTDIGINNYYANELRITGCGAALGGNTTTCTEYNAGGEVASTTGNVYGVYDMSGGSYEYTMGNMVNPSGAFFSSAAGFTTTPDAKYYDSYAYGTSGTTHARGKLGDATKETLTTFGSTSGGWTSDDAHIPQSNGAWFFRGGHYWSGSNAGVFNFAYSEGNYSSYSARAVLAR